MKLNFVYRVIQPFNHIISILYDAHQTSGAYVLFYHRTQRYLYFDLLKRANGMVYLGDQETRVVWYPKLWQYMLHQCNNAVSLQLTCSSRIFKSL